MKYVLMFFMNPDVRRNTFRNDLMKAIKESDMRTVISVLIHHANEISRKFPFEDKELASLLLQKDNLKTSQMLVWYKSLDTVSTVQYSTGVSKVRL